MLAVDQNSFIVDNIDDGGDVSFEGTVVNSGDTTDLDELGIALQIIDIFTIIEVLIN